jgi:hypothetical protein
VTAGATPADRARAEREAQGKPPTVTDPAVYERLAVILRNVEKRSAA